MNFFVLLQNENTVVAMPTEHVTRLNADVAAGDALKSHLPISNGTGNPAPATKALICQVVAHAEANITITDHK